MRTEVQQRALAHFVADAYGLNQAKGEVVILGADGAGFGTSNKHGGDTTGGVNKCQYPKRRLWHYISLLAIRLNINQRLTSRKTSKNW